MSKLHILCIFLSLTNCSKGVHLIGVDTKGFERKLKIEDEVLSTELGKHLIKAHESIDLELSASPFKDDSWKIETVIIGIGIEGEINILDSWKFKASPAIQIAIQKVENET
ncbi:MAG: hypothetical protein AB8C84_00260 [Oligoflexales bacterium]